MRHFKITVNGNTYEVEVEELTNGGSAPVFTAPVNTNPEPAPVQPEPKKITAQGTQLKAPMPGTILKVPVKNGATVKKGDVIVVLEAMKLENDIYAPADGVVTLAVSQGASVNTGDLIAVIS
ncbi:MAG TPA: biotin/lipoyl-containing protein [Clostridia bacterium]|jgi:biotin carboxyl carrier protein